jgi:ATP-dependent helicase/nuclease subunit A
VYPSQATKRTPAPAPGCPKFGDDSVLGRGANAQVAMPDSVAPGRHTPRAGTHSVVWWDPRTLVLDKELGGGIRNAHILAADESNEVATQSEALHQAWITRRATALAAGKLPSIVSRSVTDVAKRSPPPGILSVEVHETRAPRTNRPGGKRFGTLVHATMAAIDLSGDESHVRTVARSQARLVGAPTHEVDAAVIAVLAALEHPLVRQAAASPKLRREVPVMLKTEGALVDGVVDLAYEVDGIWQIVDFKTDSELVASRIVYEAQVRIYAQAIAKATGASTRAALLML